MTWRTNLVGAMAEAHEQNRPLFVTFRCLPCQQCAAFDKEVLEGGPELDPLLIQFITVRLTDAAAIDLRMFPVEGVCGPGFVVVGLVSVPGGAGLWSVWRAR